MNPRLSFRILLGLLLGVACWLYLDAMRVGSVGYMNDDGLYVTSARGIAEGLGYVYTFLPGLPTADRFPIGYPAILALIVRIIPEGPEQLLAMQGFSVVCTIVFLGLSYGTLRLLTVGRFWALAAVALVAGYPFTIKYAGMVMSEMPFAALSVIALWLILRTKGPKWALATGLVLGSAILVRYIGVALLAAAVLAYLWNGKRKEAIAISASALGVLLPWGLWVFGRRSFGYLVEARKYAPTDWLIEAQNGGYLLFAKALPSVFLPQRFVQSYPWNPAIEATPPIAAAFGIGLSIGVLASLVVWFVRTKGQLTVVAPLYALFSLGIIYLWNLSFTGLGYEQYARMVLPLFPLAIAAPVLALRDWAEPRQLLAGAVAVAVLALGLTGETMLWLEERSHRGKLAQMDRDYMELYAFLRLGTPEGATLASRHAPMVFMNTGRHCEILDDDPARALEYLRRKRIGYVIGTPWMEKGYDMSVRHINTLRQRNPGLLEPVYVNGEGNFSVWRVNHGG